MTISTVAPRQSGFHTSGRANSSARRLRRLLGRNRLVLVGFSIVVFFVVVAVFGDLIAPKEPLAINADMSLSGPSTGAFFGTDRLGRDVFSRVVISTRIALIIPVVAVGTALLVGGSLGLIAGYFGSWLDHIISRTMDVIFGFPFILFVIAVVAVLGPGEINGALAMAVVFVPVFVRVARGPTLAEREKEYAVAAHAIGATDAAVIVRHVLPNIVPTMVIQASSAFASAILIEASISYLGLGTPPHNPSWGRLLADGRPLLEVAPWTSVFPGVAIMMSVFAFQLLGDGLRDILDPRLR